MASLATHINVWETCLQQLHRNGFTLRVEFDEDERPRYWYAERDRFDFVADNPIELLGLTSVYEDIRPTRDDPYWWSASTDTSIQILDHLYRNAEDREVLALKWRERPDWAARVREAWHGNENNLKDTADTHGFCVRIIQPLLMDMGLLADDVQP